MNGLFFCSYLHAFDDAYCSEKDVRGTLVQDLLCACCDANEREAFRYGIDISTSTLSFYYSGTRIPAGAFRGYKFSEDVKEKSTYPYFKNVILDKIPDYRIDIVKQRLLHMIESDRFMSADTKRALLELKNGPNEKLLAEAFIYALWQPKPNDKTKAAYPNFPINNLPFSRNEYFTGRTEMLECLKQGILDKVPIQTVTGLSGVGKTQLAIEFVYLNYALFDYVWWINAETENTIIEAFAEVAKCLKMQSRSSDKYEPIRDVLTWTNSNGIWLFIFDNATLKDGEAFELLHKYAPKNYKNGSILILSQNSSAMVSGCSIHLTMLTDDESMSFLEKRAHIDEVDGSRKGLCTRLGNYPLALEQAGAFLAAHPGVTATAYCDLLNAESFSVFDKSAFPNNYEKSAREAIRVAIKSINNAEALALLRELSSYASSRQDLMWLKRIRDEYEICSSDPLREIFSSPLAFLNAVDALKEYSLCTCEYTDDPDYESLGGVHNLYIHRIIKKIVRDELGDASNPGAKCDTCYYGCCWRFGERD